MITSIQDNHSHQWKKGEKFTSVNDGHRHRVDVRSNLAIPTKVGGHFHTLRDGGVK